MASSLGSVLVYGAAGAQGSAILRALLAAEARVRLLLRDASTNPFGGRVDVVHGDLADPARLKLANLGIDAVVLTLPVRTAPAQKVQFARNAIEAAQTAGVRLMVWNATGLMPADTGLPVFDTARDIHARLRASGLAHIVLRPSLYMENLMGPWSAPAIVHDGLLAYPLPADFKVSWISHDDLGAFVVAALKRPDLAGRAFDIGGPAALTGTELAEILAAAVGRQVTYIPVPLGDFAAAVNATLGDGAGDEVAAVYAWYQKQTASPLAIDLRETLSDLPIRPTAFADWARAQDWPAIAARARAA